MCGFWGRSNTPGKPSLKKKPDSSSVRLRREFIKRPYLDKGRSHVGLNQETPGVWGLRKSEVDGRRRGGQGSRDVCCLFVFFRRGN